MPAVASPTTSSRHGHSTRRLRTTQKSSTRYPKTSRHQDSLNQSRSHTMAQAPTVPAEVDPAGVLWVRVMRRGPNLAHHRLRQEAIVWRTRSALRTAHPVDRAMHGQNGRERRWRSYWEKSAVISVRLTSGMPKSTDADQPVLYPTRFLEAEDLANNFLFNVSSMAFGRFACDGFRLTCAVRQDLAASHLRLICST